MAKASVESIFCGTAEGGADGTLLSPGVQGVHALLGGSQASVSAEAIRTVYQEQEWPENASLNQEQFTLLWKAINVDGSSMPAQQREVLPVTGKVGAGSAGAAGPRWRRAKSRRLKPPATAKQGIALDAATASSAAMVVSPGAAVQTMDDD